MAGILIDLVLVAIAALCILRGWQKGFVSSVIGLGRFALSLFLSYFLSAPLANAMQPAILEKLGGGESENFFSNLLAGIVSSGYVARVLAFAILFLASSLLIKVLEVILNLFVKLPVLKFANNLLGVLVGVLTAFFWVELLTVLFMVAATYFSESVSWLSAETFDKTFLAKFFYEHNFFRAIFEAITG